MSVHQCFQRSQQIALLEIIHSNDGMDPIKLGRHDNSSVGSRFRITFFFFFFLKWGKLTGYVQRWEPFLWVSNRPVEIASLSAWETKKVLAGGSRGAIPAPPCQSTTCIVALRHFRTSGVHSMFRSSRFSTGRKLPISAEGICGLRARKWRGGRAARLPVWLPWPSGDAGREEEN